ncbi:MAG TPA: pilus assembly protein TadG-related protein, partial [Hyphomicrobiaceae bacterium]|nr:pilus assembly protein TadG-related protein [Hyphomicrobiaceae bacterium]
MSVVRKFIQRFVASRDAAIAPIFAISLVALAGVVGVAVDFGRAHAARQAVQAALDAAVFSAAKDVALKGADVNQALTRFFNARPPATQGLKITSVSGSSNTQGVVTGQVVSFLDASFMKVMGINRIDIRAPRKIPL